MKISHSPFRLLPIFILLLSVSVFGQAQLATLDPQVFITTRFLDVNHEFLERASFDFAFDEILQPSEVGYVNIVIDFDNSGCFGFYEWDIFFQNEWIIQNVPLPITPEIFSEPLISIWYEFYDSRIPIPGELWFGFSVTAEPIDLTLPVLHGDLPPEWYQSVVVLDETIWGGNDLTGQDYIEIPTTPSVPQPEGIIIHENPGQNDASGMPDITQQTNECGPTSAANSLIWLAKNNGFADKLPQDGNGNIDQDQLILDLMEACTGSRTRPFGGLTGDQLYDGKVKYAQENNLPIYVHGGNTNASATGASSIDFIMEELLKGQDVELLVWWPVSGGHWVTVTGFGIVDGKWVLYVHDPDDGKTGKAVWTLETDIEGNFSGNFSSPDCEAAWAVAESPLPPTIGDLIFEQIELEYPEGSLGLTNWGRVTIPFTPAEEDLFFNLVAPDPVTDEPIWLVQNLWLPGSEYTTYPQQFTTRFPLDLLGVDEGELLTSWEFGWNAYAEPIMEPLTEDEILLVEYAIETVELYLLGRLFEEGGTPPELTFLDWFPDEWVSILVEDIFYISCNPDDPTSMPNIDLDKGARDGELNGCGPAAAANSLLWLEKNHSQIDLTPEQRAAFNQLSNLMNRPSNKGTYDKDFIKAKLDFIEMYDLPIKVKYQDDAIDGAVKSTTGRTEAECKDANAAAYPTKDWMLSEAQAGEDVEVGCTYPGPDNGGHWVAMSGFVTVAGQSYLYWKDDDKQRVAGGTDTDHSRIVMDGDKMKLPGLGNATIDIVVSESYDPDHQTPSSEANYEKYCQWTKRIIPPGYTLEVTYPDDVDRCYNSTIWVLDRTVRPAVWKKVKVWNFNKGKTRKYVNDTNLPITVAIHNDDKYSAGTGSLLKGVNTYTPYTINAPVALPTQPGDETDVSNENEYGGFSLGADDDTTDEFGDITDATVNYTVEIGCSLGDLPKTMNPSGTTTLNISYNITDINDYWSDLEFNMGLVNINETGTVNISSPTLTLDEDIVLTGSETEIVLDIGGVTLAGNFELTISTDGTADIELDNIGIASKVDMATDTDDEIGQSVPTEYQLMQNYPNPFNPSTIISYGIPSAETVTLKIYNTLGQEVATLVDEFQQAGYHSIEWNIGDLGSGIYFYKLTAGSFSDTKKCVILK
ncbi:T9SS type A sorting domain-containing protein [Bacteroidota bacterium]